MKKREWSEGLDNIDPDLVEKYVEQKDKLRQKKHSRGAWLRVSAVAASLVLIVSAVFVLPMLQEDEPGAVPTPDTAEETEYVPLTDTVVEPSDTDTPQTDNSGETEKVEPPEDDPQTPTVFEPIVSSEKLLGNSLDFVVGSSVSVDGFTEAEPPAFEFDVGSFNVKARVVKIHPDIYYKIDVSSEYKPKEYRLIQMETVEVICGENVPQYFLYLLPNYLYVDMSVYDSLIISMTQLGTENYVLRNSTKKQMEAFKLPIFADIQDLPQLGNIIAFSDGIFDEGLWQNESWIYGYQFGEYYLDHPEYGDLVVSRGAPESDVIAKIENRISERKEHLGERYKDPKVRTLSFTSQAAKDAIEYVKPFENGVFSQEYNKWWENGKLIFKRFVNGCQTEETITIDFLTEEVTYSEVRYTDEDIAKLTDLSVLIAERAEQYKEQTPTPPHTDTEGKKLLCLNIYGWYAKVDGKLYGVIKTCWRYQEEDDFFIQYYDDSYTLYEMTEETKREISRDELIEIVGTRNVYRYQYGEYGEPIVVPE